MARTRWIFVCLAVGAGLLTAGMASLAGAATSRLVPASSGPAGSLAVVAGVNHPVVAGSATGTPLSARGVAVDGSGNLYIADPQNDVIEEVTTGGVLSIIAGTGQAGLPTVGAATSSSLNHPDGLAVDASGQHLYIADTGNDAVEEVTLSTGQLSIIAGIPGTPGSPTPGSATSSHLQDPGAVAVDGSGNVYIADTNNNLVEEVSGGTLSIIAGTGTSGLPTPGPATSSDLAKPFGVAVDGSGNVYIADTGNNAVEEVSAGTLSIFAGSSTGTSGAPTPGPATSSNLSSPSGVAVDGSGNVYIADRANQRIEKVTAGTLSVFAGNGTQAAPTPGPVGSSSLFDPSAVAVSSSGDLYIAEGSVGVVAEVSGTTLSIPAGMVDYGAPTAGPATASLLSNPSGVAVDASGNIYVADPANDVVEKITPSGTLSIFAGTGHPGDPIPGPATSSPLRYPSGVAVDASGNVYIADTTNSGVEKVTPGGTLSVVAGTGASGPPTPGPATHSKLDHPSGVAVDGSGNVYIADTGNNMVEEVTPGSPGTLSIFAGTGSSGPATAGPATSSDLFNPTGVAVDGSGHVYIADSGNQRIEEVAGGSLSFFAGNGSNGNPTPGPATGSNLSSPGGVAVDSGGNVYIADTTNNQIEKVATDGTLSIIAGTGNAGPPIQGPASASDLRSPAGVTADALGNLYIADAGNSDVEEVFGVASVKVDPTSTVLFCLPATVNAGAATTCSATVRDTASFGPLTPTGTVSFASSPSSGSFSNSGSCQLSSTTAGTASCQVSFTPSAAGSYTVTASYGGDSQHHASQQSATVTGQQPPTTTTPSPGVASVYHLRVAGTALKLSIGCAGGSACAVRLKLTARETLKHGKLVAVAAGGKLTRRTVTVGSASVVVPAGGSRTVKLSLNGQGRRLLKKHSPLKVRLTVTQTGKTVYRSVVTFKKAKRKH